MPNMDATEALLLALPAEAPPEERRGDGALPVLELPAEERRSLATVPGGGEGERLRERVIGSPP